METISNLSIAITSQWRSGENARPRSISFDGLGPGARVRLGCPRQCLRVDIFLNLRQFAILKRDIEDPMVFKRFIRGFDSPSSDADDQDPVSLRYELGGALGTKFPPFR